jgi:uncharacterized paraquat-inducible protein A
MQPVPPDMARCPRCATPHRNGRRTSLWLGAAIALAVAFVVGLMIYSIRQDDIMNSPSEGTEQSVPAQPDKPPPLNK